MREPQLVSVIIPTYNSARYIRRCLTSILYQTYKFIQIIIVDAGSTDGTQDLINQFKDKLNIEFYILEQSTQGEARNLGLEHAIGEYICFCDSDDFYLPKKIEDQVQLMKNEAIDAAYFDPLHFRSHNKKVFFVNEFPSAESMIAQLITHSAINLCSLIIKKDFLDKTKLRFSSGKVGRYADDWDFIFRLAVAGAKFQKARESLAVVEIRDNSHTQWDCQWLMKHHVIQLLIAAKRDLDPRYYSLVDRSVERMKLKLAVALLMVAKYEDAKENLISIFPNKKLLIDLCFFVLKCIPNKWLKWLLIKFWTLYSKSHTNVQPIDDELLMQLMVIQ